MNKEMRLFEVRMKKEMRLLKVGDKVYKKIHSRHGREFILSLSTVTRLTKTQAVLENGVNLINKPIRPYFASEPVGYSQNIDRYEKWSIQTEEVLSEWAIEQERVRVSRWFDAQKFTDYEKGCIYNLITELNKSNNEK